MDNKCEEKLSNPEIERYSRQLILEQFGIKSQLKLREKSALVVGCGGLGCPSALYLSAAGIGRLGLVDYDTIEISNIHRQIAHSTICVGKTKAKNLAERCKELNNLVIYDIHELAFEKSAAIALVEQYDVILDCTDNVMTRYLLNDVCVLLKKPLISGSALKFEGQLTVYNYLNGPCYRCLFPTAPRADTVANCSDAGILGPIVGMIGSLQALETIKVLTNIGCPLAGRMMIFDGLDFTSRVVKLRSRQIQSCVICQAATSSSLSIPKVEEILNKINYNQFCGVSNYTDKSINVRLLDTSDRISCSDYYQKMSKEANKSHILIDTRPKCQFQICAIPNSINIPFEEFFDSNLESTIKDIRKSLNNLKSEKKSIFVVCRRGNDSQITVDLLKKKLIELDSVKDLIGGLQEWSKTVDPNFPKY